jgi:hypothetical protein
MKKTLIIFLFLSNFCFSQVTPNPAAFLYFKEFFEDAVFFSDKFITPATDAAVYQAAGGWIYSAKKNELWSTSLAIHSNVFFVPNSDREFVLSDSDFKFLKILNSTSATVPTALGNDDFVRIIDIYGVINPAQPIKTPKGVNQEIIFYPHLSGSICLGYGTEVLAKFAPKTKIKQGEYQVYGLGLKHNLSHYIPALDKNKINLAMTLNYSEENISFDFLDVQTNYGTLGINKINGNVKSWQFQTNVSKDFGKFEIMLGSMINFSDFKYKFSGENGTIDYVFQPLFGSTSQEYFNKSLEKIYKFKINSIYELSLTYNFRKFYFQSAIAFNKFINSNISVHYKFN